MLQCRRPGQRNVSRARNCFSGVGTGCCHNTASGSGSSPDRGVIGALRSTGSGPNPLGSTIFEADDEEDTVDEQDAAVGTWGAAALTPRLAS